jgi:hypothetical protein
MQMSSRRDWCKKLYYRSGKKWRALPDWALSLIHIGWELENLSKAEDRVTTVLILPHRAFAASFLGLGATLAQSVPRLKPGDIENHFAKLLGLSSAGVPTPLLYLRNGVCFNGAFDGVQEIDGEKFVRVTVNASVAGKTGRNTYFVGRGNSHNLHIDQDSSFVLTKVAHKRDVLSNRDFLSGLYSDDEASSLHIAANPSVTLVTKMNSLKEEVLEEEFACLDDSGKYYSGTLNDVLRIDRFVPTSVRPRILLLPASLSEETIVPAMIESGVVILDGAQAYTQWSHHFTHANVVTLLSHTDTNVELVVDEINRRYLGKSDSQDTLLTEALKVPNKGAEGVVFWEKRR